MPEKEFNIPMTREIQGEVSGMCNYGNAIQIHGERIGQQRGERIGQQRGERIGQQRGERIGTEKTMLNNLRSLMKAMGLSAQQAMEVLGVPPEERERYASQL